MFQQQACRAWHTRCGHRRAGNQKYGLEDYIKILPVKASQNGSFAERDVVKAISYVENLATQDKTIVINMSLTSYYWGKNSDVDVAVQSAVRGGVIVCAAAGNEGYNSSSAGKSLGSPACLENVIGVMNYKEGLIPAPKSNYGAGVRHCGAGTKNNKRGKVGRNRSVLHERRHEHGNAFRILCGGGAGNKIQQEIGNRLRRDDKYSCRCDRHSIVRKRCLYRKKLNLSAFVEFKHIKEIKVFTEDESLDALNQNISSPKKSSLLQSSDTLTKKALHPKPTSRTRA